MRREAIYDGDLLVFKNIEPTAELRGLADAMIRETIATEDPVRAQFELSREEFLARIETLQKRFRRDDEVRKVFVATLEHTGVDVRHTFWDWLYLRVSPHGEEHDGRRTVRLGFHRDTWSSNIYVQTNWWAPVYPITPARTIAFYPAYWEKVLPNTSRDWDLEETRAGTSSAPLVPEPREPVDVSSELRPVIEPGDLLSFSGAHLHASVPNATGVARFSVEARTVDGRDFAAGRGGAQRGRRGPTGGLRLVSPPGQRRGVVGVKTAGDEPRSFAVGWPGVQR